MRLFHKKTNSNDRERQFMFLRVLGTASFLLFVTVFLLNSYFLYRHVYSRKADVAQLIELQTLGLPHAIHFDRLEKIEAAWKVKQEAALEQKIRNPFEASVSTDTTAS